MIVNDKTGVTLSGGGFRGIAHLGVLQYMHEMGLGIHAISGASAGALVGAMIAAGFEPLEIYHLAKGERFFSYSDVSIRSGGLFTSDLIEKLVKKYIPHDSFEALSIPLYVSVTDLTNGRPLIFNQGSLSFAVKASCCFPLVFQPVLYEEDTYLCDGGVLNNFPVEQIRATCSKTIGINVNPINRFPGRFGYREMIGRIIRMTTSKIRKESINSCDVYMMPEGIHLYSTFSMRKMEEIYQLGYDYAQSRKEDLLAIKLFQEGHQPPAAI